MEIPYERWVVLLAVTKDAETKASLPMEELADFYTNEHGPLPYAQKTYEEDALCSLFVSVFMSTYQARYLTLTSEVATGRCYISPRAAF